MKIVKWFIKSGDSVKVATLHDIIAMTSTDRSLTITETLKGKEVHKVVEFTE
jgi:hypothetical protein